MLMLVTRLEDEIRCPEINGTHGFIESVLTFGFMCWFEGLSVRSVNVLNRVVRTCGKVIGERPTAMKELYESRVVRKAWMIERDTSHVLSQYFQKLPSGRRFRMTNVKTNRRRKSFIPMAITFLNRS